MGRGTRQSENGDTGLAGGVARLDEQRSDDSGLIREVSEPLQSQALIVTAGPFKGRICLNDDDDFLQKSDLTRDERSWYKAAGVKWEITRFEDPDDETGFCTMTGVECEVVTFGFYLECRRYHYIPRQLLRSATMYDLITRTSEIGKVILDDALLPDRRADPEELVELLKELRFIENEILLRDMAMAKKGGSRKVFLCHSSQDKPFVRRVAADLTASGHKVWFDEFEINVGDSIVDKIETATSNADALVLFISNASSKSTWVRREWSSSLARQLSVGGTRILPVLIERGDVPSILSDIKYADFCESYHDGLEQLLRSLNSRTSKRTGRSAKQRIEPGSN